MAQILKLRRGTRQQHTTFVGEVGEVTVDTTSDSIRVHDGITAGGNLVATDIVSVKYFGAVGDGITDDTAAIQDAINSTSGELYFGRFKTYKITERLSLKSNLQLMGNGSVINIDGLNAAEYGIYGSSLSNIVIMDLLIEANGEFSFVPFPNPAGGGNSVGFTNDYTGIHLAGCSNVTINNCQMSGISRAITCTTPERVSITGNIISNCGWYGIRLSGYSNCEVIGNYIDGIQGNITLSGNTDIANSKFADGIFIAEGAGCIIENNQITDCKRIGVVVENVTGFTYKNTNISIINNIVTNMNGSRGTEFNAAIWTEPYKAERIIIDNNVLDNTWATTGGYGALGIWANDSIITNNRVTGFNSAGIKAFKNCLVATNSVSANGNGIIVQTTNADNITIKSNHVYSNDESGIRVECTSGVVEVLANTIRDNGQGRTSAFDNTGLLIYQFWNLCSLIVKGNTFISSVNNAATTGQLFGIVSLRGGDYDLSSQLFLDNYFIFTGTLAAYPANLGVVPACWGSSNGDFPSSVYDFINSAQGNSCNKIPDERTYADIQSLPGMPRLLGYATAAPASGTHKIGDTYLNANITAGAYIGWVCTADGTPGTWKRYGLIES